MGNGNGDGGRDEKEKREVEFVNLFGDRVYMPCGAVHVDQGVHSIYVRFPLNTHDFLSFEVLALTWTYLHSPSPYPRALCTSVFPHITTLRQQRPSFRHYPPSAILPQPLSSSPPSVPHRLRSSWFGVQKVDWFQCRLISYYPFSG